MSRLKLNDEMLIELVKRHSVLYNLGHPKYLDNKLKDYIWDKIGQQLRIDGALCKSRWNNMRDQYRKRYKDVKIKTAKGEKLIKCYKYSEQMSFLKPYFKEFKPPLWDSLTEEEVTSSERKRLDTFLDDSKDVKEEEEVEDPLHDTQEAPSSPEEKTMNPDTEEYENKVEFQEAHEMDAFLAAMAPTLKKLSRLQQHLAKAEIFAVVQKYEMQMLVENNDINDSVVITKTEFT